VISRPTRLERLAPIEPPKKSLDAIGTAKKKPAKAMVGKPAAKSARRAS